MLGVLRGAMGFILRLRIDFEVILSGAVVTITSFLAVGLAPKAVSLPRTTLQGGCMRSFRNKTKESWDIVESHRKWGHTPWGTPWDTPWEVCARQCATQNQVSKCRRTIKIGQRAHLIPLSHISLSFKDTPPGKVDFGKCSWSSVI